MQRHRLAITPEQHGLRIDMALVKSEIGLSRRKIRRILDLGGVYINGQRVRIASRIVTAGDRIEVTYHEANLVVRSGEDEVRLTFADIIYEDAHVIAINKPPGLPVQATRDQSVFHAEKALRDLIKARDGEKLAADLCLVHRLDKETTGVLLFAKTRSAMTFLTDQFRNRVVEKVYLALVYGAPDKDEFSVDNYLSAIDPSKGRVRIVRSGGKSSQTSFRCLKRNENERVSLVACHPRTGRSHQIRVHLEHVGIPILGDKRYGKQTGERSPWIDELARSHHMLHAYSLTFVTGPKSAPITVVSPLPANFLSLVSKLGFSDFSL